MQNEERQKVADWPKRTIQAPTPDRAGAVPHDAAAHAPQRFLRKDMTVRQVACDFPATRQVFVRYGEPPDRKPFGHLEPLDRFAARHNVPLDRLLAELSQAAGVPVDRHGPAAERVHRAFLATALALSLTLGAGWGAWLLWQIGLAGDFHSVPARYVVAHGDVQLWGFVGLFIAGVALRWLPVATATRPAHRLVAATIWACMVAGIAGGFVWELWPASFPALGITSGAALLIATGLLSGFLIRRVAARLPQPWACAVLAAGLWWVVWAGFTLWLRWTHNTPGPDSYTLHQRDGNIELAVFALAGNAVYGFGLRLLPGIVGGSVNQQRAMLAVTSHNVGLLLLLFGHITAQPAVEIVATMCLAGGAISFALAVPGFRRLKQFAERPEQGPQGLSRYIQLAISWLVAGVLLLVAGQAFAIAAEQPVAHAWRGAARHALTVGFLTTLIMGVAQRLLPIFGHTLLAWPRLVMPALLLVGSGNLLRVATELATLVTPAAYWVMPISSLLEVAALALFAANCLRTMWPRRDPLLTTGRVAPGSSVAVLLAEHPWLEDELIACGIDYLARTRSVPRELTMASMSRSHGQDPESLLRRINELLRQADRTSK
ncbi:MAG: hypothetical protein KatS3mg110_2915 [Pirellulaceae bacterium]|nr:MAG: hypothetical protein KatS3mg110_2915 [Pirellulaceae bacterium]